MQRYILGISGLLFNSSIAFAEPIFPNSVVSNDLEFIRTDDPSVFSCLAYDRTGRAEMPDKRRDALFADGVYLYTAQYQDGSSVGLWAHPDFGSSTSAESAVTPVAQAIGKLPTMMRSGLDHVVIHVGDETAFAEADGNFFVMYSDNIRTRIRNHDLEETVFHESVHATLDAKYLGSRVWRNAQSADNGFVTEYAARVPDKEDMAESALFAWAILQREGRLPQNVEARVRDIMPNRMAFFEELFSSQPIFYRVGDEQGC
jgi:hypothetical protein